MEVETGSWGPDGDYVISKGDGCNFGCCWYKGLDEGLLVYFQTWEEQSFTKKLPPSFGRQVLLEFLQTQEVWLAAQEDVFEQSVPWKKPWISETKSRVFNQVTHEDMSYFPKVAACLVCPLIIFE